MFKVEFKDIDLISTIDRLQRLSFNPFLNEAGKLLQERTRERWQRAVDPLGQAWAPNAGKYAGWKQKYFPGRPPLTLTGELKSKTTIYFRSGFEVNVGIQQGLHTKLKNPPKFVDEEPRDYPSIVAGLESGERGVAPRQIFGLGPQDINDVFDLFAKAFEPDFR
jgi:hypothetical protein